MHKEVEFVHLQVRVARVFVLLCVENVESRQ